MPVLDDVYYAHARREVLRLVPSDAQQVIDVGCGAGAMGAALKHERPGVQVRGIEIVAQQAGKAKEVLDDAAPIDACAPLPEGWPAPDCIVFADVLEHLLDPWETLRLWRERAKPGASLVVSLPNIGHADVLTSLLRGRFRYEDEGLLDRTHIRFFTRQTGIELIEQAGFRLEHMERLLSIPSWVPALLSHWVQRTSAQEAQGRRLGERTQLLLDLFTYQFLFVAKARA